MSVDVYPAQLYEWWGLGVGCLKRCTMVDRVAGGVWMVVCRWRCIVYTS